MTVVPSLEISNQESFIDVESLHQSTIEVQGHSAPLHEEMCRSYFENPSLSGGGHIIHLSASKDNRIVFVTFESRKDARRVVRRTHVINGYNVTVRNCISLPHTYPNMLLLTNVGDHTTEDQVSMYMENITGLEPCEVLFGEQPSVAIVKFDEQIDFNLVKESCEAITLKGCQVSVSEVPISNCLLVENVSPETTKDDLVKYFEGMSNVGPLEEVEMMPGENKCLVYFEDIKDIDFVLTQSHTINGKELKLQNYFQRLEPLCEDQIYHFIKPNSLGIKNIDHDKMALLNMSSSVRDELSQQFLTLYATFQIVDNTLIIDCTLTSSVPMAYSLARTWSHYVQVTVKNYMNHLEVHRLKTLSIVWDEVVKAVNEINQTNPDVAVVLLRPQENVIVVVGKIGARDLFLQLVSVVENIETEIERKNIKIQETDKCFHVFQLQLIQAVSQCNKVREQYKDLSIDVCFTKREVTLIGLFKDVKEVLVEMVNFLQLAKRYTIHDLPSTFRLILCSAETRGLLLEKLRNAHIIATWEEVKDNIVAYAFSDKEFLKAGDIILGTVIQHVFDISGEPTILQFLKSDDWKALALKLKSANPGKLNFSYSQTTESVLITLTLTVDILDTVRENIRLFFREHILSEQYSFSPSRQKFVSLFCKDKLMAIAASLTNHKVQITLAENGVICVQGTDEGLSILWAQLKALTEQIICHMTTVNDPLQVKFLTTEKCVKQMDIFERSSQCVLGICEEPNVIQVLTPSTNVEEYTAPRSCYTGTESPHSGANQTLYRKHPSTNVIIVQGNIANQQVDVIVNSVRPNLNLDSGGASSAVLAAGGQGLQDECRAKYPKGIQTLDIARTTGLSLSCKEVFHVALCPFQTLNAEQILETVVTKCLIQANESQYTSIAFPALGAGARGYPSDIVSYAMNRAIDSFLKTTPTIYIKSIRIVIFNDKEMIKDYRKVFSDPDKQTVLTSEFQNGYVRQSHVDTTLRKEVSYFYIEIVNGMSIEAAFKVETFWSGFMECTFGDLRLVIKPGDVTEEDAEAIVNSTNNNLDLNGTLSAMLKRKCGAAFIAECKNKVSEIKDKGVCVTKAFNLKSKVILHFNINMFPADRLCEGIETLLKEADLCHVNTVALPAIGTGAGRIPPGVLAEAMFQALVNFSKSKVQNVKEVRVVFFDSDTIPTFVSQMQVLSEKYVDKKRGIVKLLKGKTDNSSPREASLNNTLHRVAKLYIYSTDKKNVKRLIEDFEDVITDNFMRTTDTEVQDPVPYIKRRGLLKPLLARMSASPSSSDSIKAVVKLPSTWAADSQNESVKRVLLQPSQAEYKKVVKRFMESLDVLVNIISVERIQNPTLYRLYSVKKNHIEKQNSDIPEIQNEKTLWHGTTIDAIDNINHNGFNRSYCGKNATAYGEGVYFAINSAYSANSRYSTPDTSGKCYIYQCKVLTGFPTKGDNKMKVLPSRSGVVLYDSATDILDNPNLYVIFNDDQAYPEYLITFERIS